MFPLIHGRKYLPAEIRDNIRQAYNDQANVVELSNLIDEFLGVSFPRDTDRAIEIVQRVHDLLPKDIDGGITHGSGQSDCPYNPDPNAPTQPTDSLADSVAQDVKDEQGDPTQTTAGKSDSQSDTQDNDDDADVLGSGDESDDDSADESGDANGSSDGSSDSNDSSPANDADGSGSGKSTESATPDALRGILNDVLDSVLDALAHDIADIREQIVGQDSSLGSVTTGHLPRANYRDTNVSADVFNNARDFGYEMEQLKTQHDPAWELETDSGRLDIERVLNGCEPDRAFNRWTDGNEQAVEIEAVVALDISGSMGHIIDDAYRAMFQIKSGLETIPDTACSVLTYNGETHLLYSADERAGSTVRDAGYGGGTNGLIAVRHANNILAESNKAVKILFVICDGDLNGVENQVALMQQAGVLTVLAWVGGGYSDPATAPHYNFEIVASADTPSQLVQIARRVVNVAVERHVLAK
jgi:hypothetical protein